MREYIEIGPTPPDEDCQQIGENYDAVKAQAEMKRYIALLREKLGQEPDGARLTIKTFPHDFGSYSEVVCYYDTEKEDSVAYAFACESNGPMNWNDTEKFDWKAIAD